VVVKLYVGNLSRETTDQQLTDLAAPFGTAKSVIVIRDRVSGESRGFGFVEFANDDEARAAIAGLNGKEVNGRTLTVNESRPKPSGARR
jgi:RNA recognition motif-containing protein